MPASPAQAVAPSAGINNKVNYQGRLLNAAGAVVADGNYNMQFKIYKNGDGLVATDSACATLPDCQSTAGTLQWTEEWLNNASNGVTVKNGYFSVNLGSITTLVGIDLNQPVLWLSTNIAGGANTTSSCTPFSSCTPDGEMLPMRRIGSAVYAVNAGSANTCITCILQAPTSTAQNTITPTVNSVVGLTVKGTSGTAAQAVDIQQTQNAGNITTSNTGATSATLLSVSQSTSAYTGTALLVNVANGSGSFASGAFLDLQANGVSKFKIDNLGALTLAGAQTADITTLAGTAPTALVFQPGNNTSAAATGAALTLRAGNESGTTTAVGGVLTLQGGNATGASGTRTGGNVVIDAGTGATANGAISIGTANVGTITLGNTTGATAVNVNAGTGNLNLSTNSASASIIAKSNTNSVTAFQVQNASAANVLAVDTSNNKVVIGINSTGTATPAYLLLNDASSNAAGNASIVGQWNSMNSWGLGSNSNAGDSTVRLGVTGTNNLNDWSTTRNINLLVAGTALVKPTTGNDSTTAFRVQNAAGTSILSVDTVAGSVIVPQTADDATYTGFVTNDSGVLKYRTLAQTSSDILLTQGISTGVVAQTNTSGNWYRIASRATNNGRFAAKVTLTTIGGTMTPNSRSFLVQADWGSTATVSLLNQNGTSDYDRMRVVHDTVLDLTYIDVRASSTSAGASNTYVTIEPTEQAWFTPTFVAFTNVTSLGVNEVVMSTLDISANTYFGISSSNGGVDNLFKVQGSGISLNGDYTQKAASNSATSFQIQNATAVPVVNVDTTNQTLTVRAGTDTATLGADLMGVNNFATQWGTTTGWDVTTSTQATHTSGTTTITNTTAAITSGATYQVSFNISSTPTACGNSSQSVTAAIGGQTLGGVAITGDNCNGTYSYVVNTVNTNKLSFTPTGSWLGTISGVTIKQITGITNSALTVKNASGVANIEVRASSDPSNNFIGINSGQANATGYRNTALGYITLQANTTGFENTAIGSYSMQSNTTGNYNTALGSRALQFNQTGYENTAIGRGALLNNTTGFDNTATGMSALTSNTTGQHNNALGAYSLTANTTASYNNAFGTFALQANNIGSSNNAFGDASMILNTSGSYNTAVGDDTLRNNTSGSYNTALGRRAGFQDSGGQFATGAALQNATALGAYAQVQASNSIVLGSVDTATNVGIGTTIPLNTFSVSPLDYSTGTAYQSTTNITGVGTSWTSAMIGEQFIFATGQTATILTVPTSTTMTTATSQTVSSNPGIAYRIHRIGLQVTSAGLVGIGTSSPASLLYVTGGIPAVSAGAGTAATAALTVLGPNGGATTSTAGATAGAGSAISFTTGNGGAATGASGGETGGAAGTLLLQGGNGGAAINGTGGAGSNINLTAGNGGNGSTLGGAGGIITLAGGSVGTGGAATAGYVRVRNASNSTTAFAVQNASGANVLSVDTGGNAVHIGSSSGSTTPAFLYMDDWTTTATGNASITGQWPSNANWGIGPNSNVTDQVLRMGITSGDAVNTWGTAYNLNLVVAGTALVQPNAGLDSATAFAVKNGAGSSTALNVDTTTSNVSIGNALVVGGVSAERTFTKSFTNGVANQKFDLYFAPQFAGEIEVTLTSNYINQDAGGAVQKTFYLGLNAGGTIWHNDSRYSDASGATSANFAISDVTWDATNSRYRIQIVHRVSTGNDVFIDVKAINGYPGSITAISENMNTSAVYTTDTTSFVKPTVSYIDNVGIGVADAGTSRLNVQGGDTILGGNVQIGSATAADATQNNLQLDSSNVFADTGTCNATTNQGALYYNTNTNTPSVRVCEDGSWSDVVTTKDTGLIMFGVVPDSGTTPGDWVGVNGTLSASGPCRIYLGSVNTKIRWTGCTAYSNGRRVVVPAQAADQTVTLTAGHFTHVCLNTASTNQPQLLDGTSETNNLPTFSTTAPILCLADLKVNGSKITAIYDTRTFTTTTKELVNNITTAAALGMIAQQTATLGAVTRPALTLGLASMRGVFIVTAGGTTANTINAIIATAGPAFVKADAGSIQQNLESSATTNAGYSVTAAAIPAPANGYGSLGIALSAFSSTCTAATDDCRGSVATVLNIR